jgi:uncharacterized protein Usg
MFEVTPKTPAVREPSELELRLMGFSLTTADVLYHMPDHPEILQSFTWQTLDVAPRFPRIHKFLDYWVHHIEGVLHSVRLCHSGLVKPQDFRFVNGELRLH